VLTFLILGIFIVFIIAVVRIMGNRAVARYTVDTDAPIIKRGKPRIRQTVKFSAILSENTLGKLANYNMARRSPRDPEELFSKAPKKEQIWYHSRYRGTCCSHIHTV
jgi:ABC-type anion transport system, duplicated permease component